jgi:hypothetical protein
MERNMHEKELMPMAAVVTIGDRISVGSGTIHAEDEVLERQQELAEAVERHMVPVDPSLPCGCIDGRRCVHTLSGEATQPRATIAGGIVTPYAAAELIGWFGENGSANPIDRLAELQAFLEAAKIPMGNHVDTAHEESEYADGKTGCGACDRLLDNVANVYDYSVGVQGFVSALHGDDYQSELTTQWRSREEVLAANESWDPVAAMRLMGDKDGKNIEVLKTEARGVHGHREFSVVFNYMENTTLDRDAFEAETGEQVFVVDMWYIDKVARAMASGPELEEQYTALRQAMVAYQIGTYLSLCDGSQTYMTVTSAA